MRFPITTTFMQKRNTTSIVALMFVKENTSNNFLTDFSLDKVIFKKHFLTHFLFRQSDV